jgi:hypothetical protein
VLCLIADDDLHHEKENRQGCRKGPMLTACGRTVLRVSPDKPKPGRGCPVCLPDLAHPFAEVWMVCERLDRNANAGAARGPARFLQEVAR